MKTRVVIIAFLILTITSKTYSQSSIRDSAISLNLVSLNYSYLIPGADFAKRFGSGSQLGFSYSYKFKSNLLFGLSVNYLFGQNVVEQDLFKNISTSDGYLINNQGYLVPVSLELKGFNTGIHLQYILPVLGPNPNSGILFGFGSSFLQHKINLSYIYPYIYPIEEEYKKGYDRLTNGIAISQQIGYLHLGNRSMGNYHFSFWVMEGFTKSRRDFNFDQMKADLNDRLDILYGINIGIDLPLYSRIPEAYYVK